MKKLLFIFFAATSLSMAQKVTPPNEFLGYPLGSKFSYHQRILDYIQLVASQRPTQTKIIPYGKSYEGRPLQVIAVGNPTHISQLETIRTNNLKSIQLLAGQPTATVPPIAWLSYNVHGNEAVSSEAVMKVLYELLDAENPVSQKILANTVVILDPCINPDGRERYAQWYNRYVGVNPDFSPASVEHHEPWPGGRFNHYLFDLNRDWAWQTQIESQQRLALYQKWMPHLHADFHEMGPNSTYYFPPSARPYHEDLTPFQRDFQTLLGEFNKKRFDEKGWLYYTKEDYDLLYPSYGDTYPSYNGAIGMTFEQGGSGNAGLAFLRQDGDTLTLTDRIAHHTATSFSTLEAISSKPQQTVEAFRKYFNEAAANGVGKYKSFVLKGKGNEQKLKALAKTLQGMEIKVEQPTAKTARQGYNFLTKRNESFQVEPEDMVISTYQPKGKLVKILFEPETVVEDSNTYDITAWALPFAYGIPTFGINDRISSKDFSASVSRNELPQQTPYAFLVQPQSFEEIKLVGKLLKNNYVVRVHESPFKAGGQSFGHGTILITAKGNQHKPNFLSDITTWANELGVKLWPLASGLVESGADLGSNEVVALKKPKVAMVLGEGISPLAAGEVWHYFEQQLQYPITIIDQSYFGRVNLWDFTTLILPTGNYGKSMDTNELKRWLSDGGKLIALEGAIEHLAGKPDFGIKSKIADEAKPDTLPKVYGNRVREAISEQIPGAIYQVTMDATHPLGIGFNQGYQTLIRSTNTYENLVEDGWTVGYLKGDARLAGFAGNKAKKSVKDSMRMGVQPVGKGQIIYLLDNPLFRGFWYAGKQLMGNAIFFVH